MSCARAMSRSGSIIDAADAAESYASGIHLSMSDVPRQEPSTSVSAALTTEASGMREPSLLPGVPPTGA